MKAITIAIVTFLALWIFSDSPADAKDTKDTKEITIIRGGQETTVTIVTKDEAITTYIDSVINEITKEEK